MPCLQLLTLHSQANRVTDKLTHISDRIYCCRSGSAADTPYTVASEPVIVEIQPALLSP